MDSIVQFHSKHNVAEIAEPAFVAVDEISHAWFLPELTRHPLVNPQSV